MRRAADSLTGDLFAIPAPAAATCGGLDVGLRLRHLLSALLKESSLSRYEVAARMAELVGRDISKNQLDSWTAESREDWRFPLEYLPALEATLQTHAITAWVAELRGCTVLVVKDALLAELGRVERAKQDLSAREKNLKRLLGGGK